MVHMEVVDLDELFKSMATVPIIVNDFNVETEEGRDALNKLLYTRYEGDALDILPSCECGKLTGNYNVNMVCKDCQTTCLPVTERKLESVLWIRPPDGIKTFINPVMWTILSKALTISGCNLLEWLVNTSYRPATTPGLLQRLAQLELPRGLNNFHDNFDFIIDELFRNNIIKGNRQEKEELGIFLSMNRNKFFCHYLPMPSKIGFITESSANALYADTTMTLAIDALRSITSIETAVSPLTLRGKEGRAVKCISMLAAFYFRFTNTTLSKKEGIFRKHVFGCRPHFSGRAVITSISRPHRYDELHLPWSLSIQLFKVHLTSKLLKLGHTPVQIERMFSEYTLKYNPLFDQLFKELIAESPHIGIPVILQRNPTLARASAQQLFVTHVKTDPQDNTISFSVLALKGPNRLVFV